MYHSELERRTFSQTDSFSQHNLLALFVASGAGIDENEFNEIQNRVDALYNFLEQEKVHVKSQRRYIQWVFDQVRKEFFHKYETYPAFYKVFDSKTYNCLSGTALYAIFLQRLGYTIEVHETAFHAYLLVTYNKRQYLLDATDAENGFISDIYQIKHRELLYRQNEQAKLQPAFNRTITLLELAGLQYYNEAMLEYNKQNFAESANLLSKAILLYPRSERIALLQASTQNQLANISVKKGNRKKNVVPTASAGLSNQ